MRKKVVSTLLALCMVLTLVPATAWAEDKAEDFEIENGVLTKYKGSGGDVTIPAGVTSIGDSAFEDCTSLTRVTIPKSVISIGDRAFMNCKKLSDINIPVGVTSIGYRTFWDCDSLSNVQLPNSVTTIGKEAFCVSGLETINLGDGVTSIGDNAFSNCEKLTNIRIPANVASIGNQVFNGCKLTRIDVATENTTFESKDGVLIDKKQHILLRYPQMKTDDSYIIPTGITHISDWAFSNCHELKSMTIPESVTSIGKHVFWDCYNLEHINVDEGNTTFSSENNVLLDKKQHILLQYLSKKSNGSYTTPSGITRIAGSAFGSCWNLKSVTISEGVTSVGTWAFNGCDKLTSVMIPISITNIEESAFNAPLKDVYYPGSEENWKKINIQEQNTSLNHATIHYNFTGPIPTPTTFTVTFNANEGTVTNASAETGADGKLATLPTPTRDGHTFNGWYTAKSGGTQVTTDTVFDKDTTVYAQWTKNSDTPKTFTVTFDANGGAVKDALAKTDAAGKLATLPTPTREGYTFNGWYTAAAGGDKVETDRVFTADATIFAQWKANDTAPKAPFVVRFDANGGTVNDASATTDADGKLTGTLPTPTRNGYTFNGWYTAKTGGTKIEANHVFTADTTVYANWNQKSTTPSTTPSYSGGGGTVAPTHTVSAPAKVENGSVSVSPSKASKGSKVTITMKPNDGYVAQMPEILDASGKKVDVTDAGNGTYTFLMPDSAISIKASFAKQQTTPTTPETPTTPTFTDVPTGAWYADAVKTMQERKLMTGTSDTTFSPTVKMSRAMIVTVLHRLANTPHSGMVTFPDVAGGQWYSEAVAWASANGIVTGTGSGFAPNGDVTREQLAAILYRYAKSAGMNTAQSGDMAKFTDSGAVSSWASDAMRWAVGANIIGGTDAGALNPSGSATRAEVATMLARFLALTAA